MTIPMSSETTAAKKKRQELEAAKPGAYTSAWQGQMDDTMGQIMDRKPFSYDLDGDALYQNYKDRYTQQGRMAMMDTMGQAAGLTGGYGSSYAQQVGQQAYQGYMQQLSDVIPELYSLAYDRYQAEGQELKDRLSLLGAMDDRDYGRHRDTVSDWHAELGRADDDYYQLMGMDNTNYWNQKEFDYQASRDAVKDAQWRAEFEEAKRQYELELAKKYGDNGGNGDGGNGDGGDGDGGDGGPKLTAGQVYDIFVKKDDPEAEAYRKRMTGDATAGGMGDITGGGMLLSPNAVRVGIELNDLVAEGHSKSEISAYLREAHDEGIITDADYDALCSKYLARGVTY